ncbi:MAG TPA: hypothetical protein DCG73_01370 [Morganella sp. (in: Bacteria)]|nr:hypothetical protein [Morganella sp. (in: enterobacteria)]
MQNLMPPIDTTDHAFHDGDPTTGQLGTIVTAAWLNDVQGATRDIQAEIIAVLTKAGIQPNPQKQNQLAEAISQIIGSGGYATSGDLTLGLSKKIDKADIAQQLGNDTTKVPSLQLVTTELGKKASVADANSKLAKDKNGADIPDKEAFIGNLGFEASIGATGWQILPGGLIFQWGTVTGDRGNLGAAYPMAFKERVFQVLLTLNDKTAGEVEGISLYATRDNFTNKTTLIVQNKGKDLLGVTTASYFAIGK